MATGYTPQQIASIAKAQVAAALNPQVSAIRQQGSLTDQQLTQQAQNAQNAYNAVADLMKNLSGQVQAPYTAAAQTQGALGKGFSNLFAQNTQANTDQANQLLAQNNSPAHLQAPTGQADVLYALGGYDPASVLNQTGAALASAAANRPANTRLMGVQAYQAGLGKVAQNDLQTNADVAKLLSTAPALQQTAVDKINSAVLAGQKLDLQTSNDLFNQWAKTQSLKQGSQRLTLSRAKQQFDQWATSQGLNIRWANLAVSQQKAALAAAKAATQAAAGSRPKVSSSAIAKARQFLFQNANGYWALASDPETPITSTAQIRSAQAADARALAAWTKAGGPASGLPKPQPTVVRTGVAPGEDAEIQRLYITLVKQYGIPAQQAFNMVANTYKNWGNARRSAYFPNQGKGGAAQGAALSRNQLPDLARTALQIAAPQYANDQNVQALVGRIMQESGGNPAAINLWDSNAKAGHPSKGILQTIDSTFNSYALPGHTDIWNPLDNAIAAIRYMLARYGRIVGPGPGGY